MSTQEQQLFNELGFDTSVPSDDATANEENVLAEIENKEDSSLNIEQEKTEPVAQEVEETQEVVEDVVEVDEDNSFGEFVDSNVESNTDKPKDVATEHKSDVDMVSIFNEKYKTDFKSEEEIFNAATKREELTPAGASLDKFLKANPDATPFDWAEMVATDHSKVSSEWLIIRDLMSKGYSKEDAEFTYNQKFGEVAIDEDMMTDSEIESLKKKNRLNKIEENRTANELRKQRESERDKYLTSMDSYKPSEKQKDANVITDEVKVAWKSLADESMKSLETMEIPLADGKVFRFSNKEFLDKNKDSISNVEKSFNFLQKEDGSWDVVKLNKLRIIEANFDKITKALYTQGRGSGQKEVVNKGKNLSYGNPQKSTNTEVDTSMEKAIETLQRNFSGNTLSIK